MGTRRGFGRQAIGWLSALAVGAAALIAAPSASAAPDDDRHDWWELTDAPVDVVTELAPGEEGYVDFWVESYGGGCYKTCVEYHYIDLPEGLSFVDDSVYVIEAWDRTWTTYTANIKDDGQSLNAEWAPKYIGPIQRGHVLAKVAVSPDVEPGSSFAALQRHETCGNALIWDGENWIEPSCGSSTIATAATILVTPLGVPTVDPLVAVPVALLLGGTVLAVAALRRRKAAHAA